MNHLHTPLKGSGKHLCHPKVTLQESQKLHKLSSMRLENAKAKEDSMFSILEDLLSSLISQSIEVLRVSASEESYLHTDERMDNAGTPVHHQVQYHTFNAPMIPKK